MRIAEPRVRLVGHTVFTPPLDENDLVFWPDATNEVPTPLGAMRQYDGQALIEFAGRSCYESFHRPNEKTATNAGYLANIHSQKHFSVDEHASASLYFTGVSRSCTHELVRHRHLSPSQLSQRFVDGAEANYVIPPAFRGDEAGIEFLEVVQQQIDHAYRVAVEHLEHKGFRGKQAREAARAVLPNMTETKIVLTGNYRAWMEFLIKRDSPHADAEIRQVAKLVGNVLADLAPNVFGEEPRKIWNPER